MVSKLENNTQRSINNSKKKELVLNAVPNNLEEMQQVSGLAKNVVLRLQVQHTMSNFSAKIIVDAKNKTKAIFDSINTDNEFYPENPTNTKMKLNEKIEINVESDHLPHLRANLNSTLRLIQGSYNTISSVDQ